MASASTALLTVKIVTDAAASTKGMADASTRVGKFQKGVGKLAVPAGAALLAVAAFGKGAVDAASETQQAMGGIDAVFGKSADTVKGWAQTAADSAGLAASEYGNLATLIGSQLKNAQLPMDQVTGKTKDMIALGSDLAATYGGTTAEAVEALSSALKGEFDPLEKYGTSLNQTKINAALAAKGADKLTGKAAAQQKALTTLEIITSQTADATGKFAEESDTAAGAQARANAKWKNAQAVLGTALLPIVTTFTEQLAKAADWASKNATLVQILAGVLVGLAAAVLLINAALKVYRATLIVVQAVQKATWLSNPIGLVVIAIIAVVAAIILLWRKSETFRKIVLAVWAAIKTAATATWRAIRDAAVAAFNGIKSTVSSVVNWLKSAWSGVKNAFITAINAIRDTNRRIWSTVKSVAKAALDALLDPIGAVKRAFDAVVDAIRAVIDWIRKLKFPSPPSWLSKLPGVGSLSAPAPAGAVTPGLAAFGAAPTAGALTSAGGGITINVYGVLTDQDAARTIRRVLAKDDRRRTGVRVGGPRIGLVG